MATSEMLQELIRAHVSGDAERFRNVAMQVAAREARSGHRLVAGRIRDLLEETPFGSANEPLPTPIAVPPRDLRAVLDVRYSSETLEEVVLDSDAARVIDRVLAEQRGSGALAEWGLEPRRRLLFHGPPGCGKTLTASVIAHELALPLLRVRGEVLFSRYMGETSAVLDAIFTQAAKQRGVYLFDEFDALGKQRGDANDVGEARRILSSFLQLLDADQSNSVMVAATNEPSFLDAALMRRFDDVVTFDLPAEEGLVRLFQIATASYSLDSSTVNDLARQATGMSFADARRAVLDAAKAMVLDGRKALRSGDIQEALVELRDRRPLTRDP